MKRAVYVDTGFWIARLDAKDRQHGSATGILNGAFEKHEIVTSECVVGETVTYLNCSLKRHDLAVAFLDRLDASPLRLLEDAGDADRSARDLKRYSDIPLSYADCMSFALMRRQRQAFCRLRPAFRHDGFRTRDRRVSSLRHSAVRLAGRTQEHVAPRKDEDHEGDLLCHRGRRP